MDPLTSAEQDEQGRGYVPSDEPLEDVGIESDDESSKGEELAETAPSGDESEPSLPVERPAKVYAF